MNQIFQSRMIENEQEIYFCQEHKLPVVTIAMDPKLSKDQKLLCTKCLENTDKVVKVVGLRTIIQLIEENQVKKMEKVENIIKNQLTLIEQLHCIVDKMKSFVIQQLDSLNTIMNEWIKNLQQQGSQYAQYSFYEELEMIILEQNKADANLDILISEIQKTNHCWTSKLHPKLEYFNKFVDYNKCKEQLSKLELNCQRFIQSEQQYINIDPQLKPYQQEKLQEGQIKLELIDQSVRQSDTCRAIVFDQTGSIIISTQENDIKVWSFQNGTINLIKILYGHIYIIFCLVYSKKQNSFISADETLRCWQQLNQTDWVSSQPYYKHTGFVKCIILNQNEDLLFSGSDDNSIKVWKVDFNQNQLTFLYSLDKHIHGVISLSLNQSENQLVSCARDKNQIIIWERKEQDKFEFKYFVIIDVFQNIKKFSLFKYSIVKNFRYQLLHLQIINLRLWAQDNQFIWITGGKELDKLFVFELNEGVFQDNQEKTLQLITNNEICDEYRFPITYNMERNQIVVRHKTYIYIIRQMNDGKFQIVDLLNCDTYEIYGTTTNNGKYLIYWDSKNKGYSTYELLNK